MRALICALLFLSAPAMADTMTCEVHGVKNRPDLENAVFEADLTTLNAVLHMQLGGPTLTLISSDVVSEFGSPRSSCKYVYEESKHASGQVYEIAHKFSTCAGPNGALVFALHKFNLETGKGAYIEELLQIGPKSLGLPLSNCARTP